MGSPFDSGHPVPEGADLAFTDPLTGLGNLRRFFDKVDRLIVDRADDPAPFAVGILDLDGFKPINDLFGRGAGDDILQQVAIRLKASMDPHSIVTRGLSPPAATSPCRVAPGASPLRLWAARMPFTAR